MISEETAVMIVAEAELSEDNWKKEIPVREDAMRLLGNLSCNAALTARM